MQKTSPAEVKKHLYRNLVILTVGVLIAIFLVRLGIDDAIISASGRVQILANFLAGMFFTSVLTVGTAAVVLGELALDVGLVQLAFVGALGAIIGDLILFSFIRDRIADDFAALIHQQRYRGLRHILHLALWHRLLPVLGFILVASPLPDEIGLAMMGISKIKTHHLIFLSFFANFFGILIVGLVARGVLSGL
ncbi:MAG: hypothetical protein Q8O87_00440 [bacterium]|nr:hypothetical protein [bacterium]